MAKFSKKFEICGSEVTVSTERCVKVVSDNDSFYLFEGFKVPQAGTLGHNFHAYAWDGEDFKRCDDPAKWDNLPFGKAEVSDLSFDDIDYSSYEEWFAKVTFSNGQIERFYNEPHFLGRWNPSIGMDGYKASVDAGRATVVFFDQSIAWKYL